MASTFHGLEVGKRSLYAQQSALSTTGHNIANANTKGYTRQRVELVASRALSYPGMNNDRSPRQLGTGVDTTEITRIREGFLDDQIRGENQSLGYWQTTSDIYSKIEEVLNEPSDTGLQKLMDQFWQGWQDLAKNPESSAARAVVRERGVAVADAYGQMATSLNQLETDLSTIMEAKINQVNSIANQIRDLNGQIERLVPHGYTPNDLYDQRDVLIDELSKLVDVKVQPGDNGIVNITAGGQTLVAGTTAQQVAYDPNGGKLNLGAGELKLVSGELLALKEGMEDILPSIRGQLNVHATTLANEMNAIHQGGLNLEDIQANPPRNTPANILFFVDKDDPTMPPQDASRMIVNPLISESLDRIAAAKPSDDGVPSVGDGSNAQAIASLKTKTIADIGGQSSTIDDFYRSTIAGLGIRSQEAGRMADNSEVLVNQIESRRQSVSGVSLDEEMTNMIKFQQAYNAAARFVTAIDETIDKVVNGMGRVGL
ncbi:flagellar hook-associated protein FlgK [Ammoniphilus resinae]|uniref:Flagellar hook-associated protein 1 n=1 Tax=Ammoniphilus resinae TaxID=861532 RepID=A0ABS4GMN7_9BACL|nr:flagellar hook-associated protein FlgK [Ammoniphilus resinae]MBP1931501.1 flagellar hook-associated protein 1 FlgK [Ammoniphilus resinae]